MVHALRRRMVPTLRINFAKGERPYLFWVSRWAYLDSERIRYKILSKQISHGALEVLVVQEQSGGNRDTVAQLTLPARLPGGWLSRWVEMLSGELKAQFEVFDLRGVQTPEEWRRVVNRLGWSLGSESRN